MEELRHAYTSKELDVNYSVDDRIPPMSEKGPTKISMSTPNVTHDQAPNAL